jgi:hypothetical protein
MLVLGAAVSLVLIVTWRPADTKPTYTYVDAHSVAVNAADELSFTPLELSLGSGWQSTTAWVEQVPSDISKNHWHVSYVKGTSKYVAVDQSDTSIQEQFVSSFVENEFDQEVVNGKSWKTYTTENSDLVAVFYEENLVTLITANSYPLLLKVLATIK